MRIHFTLTCCVCVNPRRSDYCTRFTVLCSDGNPSFLQGLYPSCVTREHASLLARRSLLLRLGLTCQHGFLAPNSSQQMGLALVLKPRELSICSARLPTKQRSVSESGSRPVTYTGQFCRLAKSPHGSTFSFCPLRGLDWSSETSKKFLCLRQEVPFTSSAVSRVLQLLRRIFTKGDCSAP